VTDLVAYVTNDASAHIFLLIFAMFFSMQACYVNTTHPDFISGHKVCCTHNITVVVCLSVSFQATAIVTERLNASKPPPGPPDPKNTRAQVNNNKDLEVDAKKGRTKLLWLVLLV